MTHLYKHILAAAATVLTLAACDKEGAEPEAGGDYPTFSATIEGAASRAINTRWEENDKIGIYGGGAVNLSHTHQGNGIFKVTDETKKIIFTDDSKIHFTAYYPYSTPATSGTHKGKIAFTSNINQTKRKDFDFLWAEADGSKASPNVELKFQHKMSKISVEFITDDDVDLSTITSYTISGLYLRGTFEPQSGDCVALTTSTGTSTVDLTRSDKDAEEPITPVIVFPQVLKANPIAFTITAANAGIGTLSGNLTFKNDTIESGKNYHFIIKISKTGLSVSHSGINDWETTDLGDTWQAW